MSDQTNPQNPAMTEEQVDAMILEMIQGHSDQVSVDAPEFLDLLKHSLSLNTMEKKRVVDAVPTLSQFQFDELTKVFSEERVKFRELAGKHPEDIKKLVAKQQSEWTQLGDIYTIEAEKKEAGDEDQDKIDDIKANLGL
ncbi:hypothetical protein MK079_04745 [Candidatus Gracilibacteria bacterium]|nr:hypothetical protein [Candidatus Gracilibacteria bacterium]